MFEKQIKACWHMIFYIRCYIFYNCFFFMPCDIFYIPIQWSGGYIFIIVCVCLCLSVFCFLFALLIHNSSKNSYLQNIFWDLMSLCFLTFLYIWNFWVSRNKAWTFPYTDVDRHLKLWGVHSLNLNYKMQLISYFDLKYIYF